MVFLFGHYLYTPIHLLYLNVQQDILIRVVYQYPSVRFNPCFIGKSSATAQNFALFVEIIVHIPPFKWVGVLI